MSVSKNSDVLVLTVVKIMPTSDFLSLITLIIGKSLSEAFIFASTNLQHYDRLFIELQVLYMKIPNSNLGRTCCVQKLCLTFKTNFVHNMFSPCSAKRRVSDKDLPVPGHFNEFSLFHLIF